MQYFSFPLPNGTIVQTCPAALGESFAAGTTDGPGAFDFTQADNDTQAQNPFWTVVSDIIKAPSPEQVACQAPKPILLDVGELSEPYAWSPNIVDIQSFRVGQLIIIVSPSEATTMTGRRWKNAVAAAATSGAIVSSTPKVVLGGPANTYAHYCATPEEYGIQRYEGASTLYGQWESNAYIYLSESYIGYLASNSTSQPPVGPLPPNNVNNSLSFIAGVVYDNPPFFKSFGEVITEPNSAYSIGDVVNATFVGANPRNNLRLEGTFTEVQQLDESTGEWSTVRGELTYQLPPSSLSQLNS
jgi:neutral ceramidase